MKLNPQETKKVLAPLHSPVIFMMDFVHPAGFWSSSLKMKDTGPRAGLELAHSATPADNKGCVLDL